MTLENLLKIGQLKIHSTDRLEVGRMLEAARRNWRRPELVTLNPQKAKQGEPPDTQVKVA